MEFHTKDRMHPLLDPGEIRLIFLDPARLRSDLDAFRKTVSADEIEKSIRLKAPGASEDFIATRGFLRARLAEQLGRAPETLRFAYGPEGKPSLEDGAGLRFNLSHTSGVAVIALARGRELGVDVERLRELESQDLAERYFSAPEAIIFRVTLPEHRELAFFHYWTSKESFIKARGDGLSLGLGNFAFSDPWEDPPRLTWTAWDETEAGRWRFHRFHPAPGFVGTLAYTGELANIREFNHL